MNESIEELWAMTLQRWDERDPFGDRPEMLFDVFNPSIPVDEVRRRVLLIFEWYSLFPERSHPELTGFGTARAQEIERELQAFTVQRSDQP
jgi:hypothetical protein